MQLAQAELISEPPGTPGTPGADPTIWDQIERVLLPVTQIATQAAKTITDIRASSAAARSQAELIAAQQRAAAAGSPFTMPRPFGMSGTTLLLLGAAGVAVFMLAKKRRR